MKVQKLYSQAPWLHWTWDGSCRVDDTFTGHAKVTQKEKFMNEIGWIAHPCPKNEELERQDSCWKGWFSSAILVLWVCMKLVSGYRNVFPAKLQWFSIDWWWQVSGVLSVWAFFWATGWLDLLDWWHLTIEVCSLILAGKYHLDLHPLPVAVTGIGMGIRTNLHLPLLLYPMYHIEFKFRFQKGAIIAKHLCPL